MNSIIKHETAIDLFGLQARAFNVVAADSGRILNQKIGTGWKEYTEGGQKYRIKAELRFDDRCGNGHEDFSITGSTERAEGGKWREDSGGCIHEEMAKRFPSLAHLIKWHLCGIAGPTHYVANTVYHAGDRDCNGLRQGEVRQIRNGRTGLPCWILEQEGDTKAERYVDAETRPAAPKFHYAPFNRVGEGKARELDHARSAAVWYEATDAELTQEPDALKAALLARLPGLLNEFKADMLACGFVWPTLPAAERGK